MAKAIAHRESGFCAGVGLSFHDLMAQYTPGMPARNKAANANAAQELIAASTLLAVEE
jgi:homogentisate 1,2-dioxygenase